MPFMSRNKLIDYPFTSLGQGLDEILKDRGFKLRHRGHVDDYEYPSLYRSYHSPEGLDGLEPWTIIVYERQIILPTLNSDYEPKTEDSTLDADFNYGCFSPREVSWLDSDAHYTFEDYLSKWKDDDCGWQYVGLYSDRDQLNINLERRCDGDFDMLFTINDASSSLFVDYLRAKYEATDLQIQCSKAEFLPRIADFIDWLR